MDINLIFKVEIQWKIFFFRIFAKFLKSLALFGYIWYYHLTFLCPHGQAVQDVALSRRKLGFDSLWGYHSKMRAVWHAFSFENALPLSCIFSFLTRKQISAINLYSRCKLPRCFANLFACFARFACNSVKIAIFHIISLFIQISDCAVSLVLTNHSASVHIAWWNIGVPTI